MRGKTAFARFAGAVALGGAFYTATYITSYPGGAPLYAVLALLAGTVGGILACAMPRSAPALVTAASLVGFGFSAAVLNSGLAFGPGLVMLIVAARWVGQRDDVPFSGAFTVGGGPGPKPAILVPEPAEAPPPPATVVFVPDPAPQDPTLVLTEAEEPVVRLPEAADVMRMSEIRDRDGVWTSDDGLTQAGPPGVIGIVGPPRRRDSSDGFR